MDIQKAHIVATYVQPDRREFRQNSLENAPERISEYFQKIFTQNYQDPSQQRFFVTARRINANDCAAQQMDTLFDSKDILRLLKASLSSPGVAQTFELLAATKNGTEAIGTLTICATRIEGEEVERESNCAQRALAALCTFIVTTGTIAYTSISAATIAKALFSFAREKSE